MIFIFVLAFSNCQKDSEENTINRKFDTKTYNSAIGTVKSLGKINYQDYKKGEIIDTEGLTEAINQLVGENVLQESVFNFFKEKNLRRETSDIDTDILSFFSEEWHNIGLDGAIENLNILLNEKNVDDYTFYRYNEFINVLKLTEIEFNNPQYKDVLMSRGPGFRCGLALASFTLATIGAGTACTPNPTTPFACPIAASRAVIAYAAMISACKEYLDSK